jgi:cobalt-zinc-cadmium efflux system membrane fusion protein
MNLSLNKNISVAMLGLLFLAACGNKQQSADADTTITAAATPKDTASTVVKQIEFTSEQYRLAGIATVAIEMRNLSNIIKLNGMIDVEPQSTAIVSAPLGGYIKTAGLLPGQAVRKGQVLATI